MRRIGHCGRIMDRVREAYAVAAEQYIDLFGAISAVHEDDLSLITRHLSTCPSTVLDVGCGPGHLTAYLRSLEVDAIGVDVVPEFIRHARATDPLGRYMFGSIHALPVAAGSVAGLLAWYSLIHVPPLVLDRVLAEFRRVMTPRGALVVGFFESNNVATFEHKVVAAHSWPVDEFVERLHRSGFSEVERLQRPGTNEARPHAVVAAIASD